MKYKKYQHVEKLGSTEVEDIVFGECYIFPKIDGTNAHIWVEDNEFHYGSRRRELSLEKDNAGFMRDALTVPNLENAIWELNANWDGCHIYGEWLVPHTIKNYKDECWRRFYIFDVVLRDGEELKYIHYNDYSEVLKKVGYTDYLAPLRIINNPKFEDIQRCAEQNNLFMKDEDSVGEGVVVKNYDYRNKYGRQTWAKLVTSDFKQKHYKEMGAPVANGTAFIEEKIVDEFLTEDIINKVHANIMSEGDGWSSKYISRLLHTCFYDLVRGRRLCKQCQQLYV